MRQPPQEVEAKFLLNDAAMAGQLAAAPTLATANLSPGITVDTADTYYDTADFRLLRQGWGLRIRRQQDRLLATLKAQRLERGAALYARTEIEETLPAGATIAARADWPAGLTTALDELVKPETPLTPICHIQQRRVKRLVQRPAEGDAADAPTDATPFAELSIDAVSVALDNRAPVLAHFHELEVELLDGDEAALVELAAAIAATLPVTPSQTSKLERALQLLATHPLAAPENWQGIHPEMHMAEACRLIWREQLTVMLLNEAGVRCGDDPEYVHDMRVAIRRARAAAKLYGDYFRPKAIRRIRKGLQRTARALGAVRDLDVAILRLERFERQSSRNADLRATLTQWRAQRSAAHAQLQAWLSSQRYERFLAEWHTFCTMPGKGVRRFEPKSGQAPTPVQVRHVMPSTILNRFEEVRAFETLFETDEVLSAEMLHQLRIACKYLRYNLEFVRSLLGTRADALIKDLRRLQDDLGDLNDAVVSKRMLAGDPPAALEPGQMRYLRVQEKTIDKLRRKAGADFAHFVAPTNRQRLALVIARI
jgi:triphosphatase